MTNVALLFALDPEIPRLLRGWVAMSGWFVDPKGRGSWNVICDPVAATTALRAPVSRSFQIGEDVTTHCRLPGSEVRKRVSGPLLSVVHKMAEIWRRDSTEVVFHDPLVAAVIFDEALCTFARGSVAVDLSTGATKFEKADGCRHEVAVDDPPAIVPFCVHAVESLKIHGNDASVENESKIIARLGRARTRRRLGHLPPADFCGFCSHPGSIRPSW